MTLYYLRSILVAVVLEVRYRHKWNVRDISACVKWRLWWITTKPMVLWSRLVNVYIVQVFRGPGVQGYLHEVGKRQYRLLNGAIGSPIQTEFSDQNWLSKTPVRNSRLKRPKKVEADKRIYWRKEMENAGTAIFVVVFQCFQVNMIWDITLQDRVCVNEERGNCHRSINFK